MTSRTRFLDESVLSAVADGAKQLVILGGGLDTRAGRMQEVLEGVRVFEVDLPSAQEAKRAARRRAGLADDWGAEFVPVDFRETNWAEKLCQAGCDLDGARTHVLWEGVIYYLTDKGVARTLRAFRKPGVSLSFDLINEDRARGEDCSDPGMRQWARYAASVGEPIMYGGDFERIQEWAASHGWHATDSLCNPEDINARFFPDPEPGHEPYAFDGLATMRPGLS